MSEHDKRNYWRGISIKVEFRSVWSVNPERAVSSTSTWEK